MLQDQHIFTMLADATRVFRNGPEMKAKTENGVAVYELVGFPSIPSDANELAGLVLFDCHFLTIGVDPVKAEKERDSVIQLVLGQRSIFGSGASYIEIGAWLGDQTAAFQFMALGEYLGLWYVMTPKNIGFPPEIYDQAAGLGYVLTTPFPKIPTEPADVGRPRANVDIGLSVLCPYCKRAHTAQLVGGGPMETGDVSICVECGEVAIADLSLPGKLRTPDGMERGNILADSDVMAALSAWADVTRRRTNALSN